MHDPAWKKRYRIRAGIEGTLSQAVRAFGLRRSRYIGLVKTGLQQVCTAAAMNVSRVVSWLDGVPRVRIPTMSAGHSDMMSATDSDPSRPAVPIDVGRVAHCPLDWVDVSMVAG